MAHRSSSAGDRTLAVVLAFAGAGALIGSEAVGATQPQGIPSGDVQGWFLQWPLPEGAER